MAQVRDVAFAGRGYEHALVGEGTLLFTRVFSPQRWPRGSTVGVRLLPDGCLVLPADKARGQTSEQARDEKDLVDLTEVSNK